MMADTPDQGLAGSGASSNNHMTGLTQESVVFLVYTQSSLPSSAPPNLF